jgi:hypothetical protein
MGDLGANAMDAGANADGDGGYPTITKDAGLDAPSRSDSATREDASTADAVAVPDVWIVPPYGAPPYGGGPPSDLP